uniref:Arginyltransferase 1 n=1 Tax=Mus musculus TaxID=10090 RepID=A0A140LJJ7_MOUSE
MASWSAPSPSLVEYFEGQTSFQCGYCKNKLGSRSYEVGNMCTNLSWIKHAVLSIQ